ncbi:hypothetical protein DE146DRAFT_763642 [Phaeosphaeria sp. MPI-PUGE-AT-0046c]|nr:hypothetical protein DE146DRAFT_763642 [Phaeosphaeria sp. MPI-PUGE-AT-0046c]
MADSGKQRATAEKNKAKLTSNIDLQSPLGLSHTDTPTSTSSLTCSPTDLTPLVASVDSIGLQPRTSHTCTRTPVAMYLDATLPWDETYTESPPADLHSKLQEQTPEYSRTAAIANFHGAFQSGRMLQQVLGFQPPEPYARPPPVPLNLEQRFGAGLQEYGLDLIMPSGNPVEMIRQATNIQKKVTAGIALGTKVLDDIKEEMESPTKAAHGHAGSESSSGLTENPSVWNPNRKAKRVPGQRFRDNEQNIRAHFAQNQHRTAPIDVRPLTAQHSEDNSGTEYNEEDFYDRYAAFGSTTTLVDSEPNTGQVDSIASAECTTQGTIGAGYKAPLRSSSLVNVTHHMPGQDAQQLGKTYVDKYCRPRALNDVKDRGSSAPTVLFPPQQVDKEQSWDVSQDHRVASAPDSFATGNHALDDAGILAHSVTSKHGRHGVPVSRSTTPIPSLPFSKKRSATSQGAPTAKVRLGESTTGLPILDASQELLWRTKFPGNTYALLTIILTWTLSMQRMHKELRDPYCFSLNPAFPYPIIPPIHQKLVSVAFYDNSMTPHKEIRFIGPSDVAEMSYNEVDIFSTSSPTQSERASRLCAMKRALGLKSTSASSNADGTGRWSYIILKAHGLDPPTTTAPHVMVAWPKSAVTNSSDCLHTVYADAAPVARPPPVKVLKRFSSLQNLASAMRLDKTLRAASSSAYLPAAEEEEITEGALMLMRRVVKMEMAGKIPLIEGYRVDVKSWAGWLEAVGKGKGKVIMWMERE